MENTRRHLLLATVAVLLSASCPAVSVVVDLPSPKPGPALAARIAAGDCEVYGIVHWGLNTYTDREWGYGDEDPALLNPAKFDADQIVGACKACGLGGLIVVAKHHDGFCLWPTKTTDHNITKTPFWRGTGSVERGTGRAVSMKPPCDGRDYVKEMEQACRREGLKFGVYVSPWDRHDADYASPKYVEKYHAQIKELLSGDYGEIFEMWFDGANGGDGWYGGAKERRRISGDYYRFPEVFKFVRELQPKVCIFAGESDESDFRWPGNEKGELDHDSCATICSTGGFADGKYGNPDYKEHMNTGMRLFDTPSFFRVCECDFPMRPGWFYHAKDKGKTKCGLYLLQRYLNTVGNGGTMNLGIAPNKDGLLDDEDVKALADFGKLKAKFFSKPVTNGLCNVVVMSEDVVKYGETCEEWLLYEGDKEDFDIDEVNELVHGNHVGIKRIRTLERPRRAEKLHLNVYGDGPGALPMKFYYVEPDFLKAVLFATTESGETDTAKWMAAGKQDSTDVH